MSQIVTGVSHDDVSFTALVLTSVEPYYVISSP